MSSPPEQDWPSNYFNYFTEVEEHFQKARGTSLFLLSPLDWALLESWKNGGVPLEAVLRGIDASFEKWRSRKRRTQQVNSLAYCAQAVVQEAQRMADSSTGQPAANANAAPFSAEALRRYLQGNAQALAASPIETLRNMGASLESLAANVEECMRDVEDLERRLTAMDEKVLAALKLAQPEDDLLEIRRGLDAQLRPYRGKMSAEQLRQLEEQYLSRQLLQRAGLPRLSLFYMTDYGV